MQLCWSNFYTWKSSRGNCRGISVGGRGGSNCLGDNSLGVIAWGIIILGENCPGDNCPRWQLSEGNCLGDNCSGTIVQEEVVLFPLKG